jgi:predicted nucleic acid-binding protein
MPSKLPLIAVDTNVLLDLSFGVEAAWDCLDALKKRKVVPRLVVMPTVVQELLHLAECSQQGTTRAAALKALTSMLSWGITPLDLKPVGHGIVERIGDEVRAKGLLPPEEINDSFIIAEAALCECDILISSDRMLYGIDQAALRSLLESYHVHPITILWPKQVVRVLGR